MTISRARTAASGAQAPCWVFEGLDAAIIAAGVLLKARTGRDWAVIPKLKGQEMRVLKRNKVRDCSNERWRLLPILAGLVATGLFISSAAAESTIWLEAEQFDQRGGWVNDSQFIDQMGSPYLIANGLGKPVADAVKTVTIANAGRYRLWVRTKDWAPEHHPGRFAILLGDRAADHVFGASGKTGWQWEDGGAHELSGTVKVGLRDLTGYYGRCDVIVLCDDLNWTPPQDKDAIARLREQFGAVSRTVKTIGEYDVVVVGGGLAGCMAAVSAARMGAHTALIQDRPVLGGNASVEVLVPPVGARPEDKLGLDPRETGLVEEIRTAGDQRTAEARVYSGRLDRLVRAEPNLDLWLNTHAEGVEMKSADTIGAVTAVDVNSGQRMRFGGRTFVDCTGDGVIGVEAGAEFRHGREPRSMYNESMAPEVGDNQTMGNSLKYVSEETSAPQQFEAPPWAMKFDSCDKFPPRRHPPLGGDIGWQWMIELGGTRNTYLDAEEIRDDLLRLIYGLWDHVKNHCAEQRQKAANHRLVWVEYVAGKRESRRLIGDYVLTENDIAGQTLFPDRVAYGGWGADDHFPEGFFYSGLPSQHLYRGVLFSIPYRSLYSRNIQNLLMAGRNISASHIALGATRVMLTCAVIGQSAGTAAAMCVEHNARARGIHGKYLTQLQQQILKDGAYIIGLPNRDRRDLARKATVRASSEQTDQSGKVMVAANVINGYARVEGDNFNAWMPDPQEPLPQWIELAWNKPQTLNMVHVTFLTASRAPARFALLAWHNDNWTTLAERADTRFRRHLIGFEPTTTQRIRLVLLSARSREMGVCEIRAYLEPARLVEIADRAWHNVNLPDGGPGFPWPDAQLELVGIAPAKLPGAVIDDTNAVLIGKWSASGSIQPFVLAGYLHDGNSDKGARSATFIPNLARAGTYEIRFAYTASGNRATNVPVMIRTSRGSQTVRINQRKKPPIDGLFVSLGSFYLDAGSSTEIVVSNEGTDGYVVVDALQFIEK